MKQKIEALEAFASNTVGDGKTPNLFFVCDEGVVITITRDAQRAYNEWRELAARRPLKESSLEDRKNGTVCSVEPSSDEPGAKLFTWDDAKSFLGITNQY